MSQPGSRDHRSNAHLPVSRDPAAVSVKDEVTRRMTVIAKRVDITATFDTHPAEIDRILASARLPRPVTRSADAAAAGRGHRAAPKRTSGAGQAPLEAQRAARAKLRRASPLPRARLRHLRCAQRGRDAGLAPFALSGGRDLHRRLGFSVRAAQPDLVLGQGRGRGWLAFHADVRRTQAAFGELGSSAARQGAAAAADAVLQAKRLGFGPGTPNLLRHGGLQARAGRGGPAIPVGLDRDAACQGYFSGVYSSSTCGVSELAQQYGGGRYAMPDIIYDALWNGQASTTDPVLRPGEWSITTGYINTTAMSRRPMAVPPSRLTRITWMSRGLSGPPPSPVAATYPAGRAGPGIRAGRSTPVPQRR